MMNPKHLGLALVSLLLFTPMLPAGQATPADGDLPDPADIAPVLTILEEAETAIAMLTHYQEGVCVLEGPGSCEGWLNGAKQNATDLIQCLEQALPWANIGPPPLACLWGLGRQVCVSFAFSVVDFGVEFVGREGLAGIRVSGIYGTPFEYVLGGPTTSPKIPHPGEFVPGTLTLGTDIADKGGC